MTRPPPGRKYRIENCEFTAPALAPGLHVVGTPLGNLGDISLRALATLAGADFVVCEDSRVTGKLLRHFAIATTIRVYHDHNAARIRPVLLQAMQDGRSLALVSDAGMPLVSDPGFKLVRDCLSAGVDVDVVPGPTAPVAALALSGLPTDRFMFCGFLPPRTQARRRALAELPDDAGTLILFEGASRLAETLADIADVLGDPPTVVAREMTKLHQEVLRDTASALAIRLAERGQVRGEVTIVIGPRRPAAAGDAADIRRRLSELLLEMPPARAAAHLAKDTGLARADLYRLALEIRDHADTFDK